jgi:hypothetical protein
MGKLRHGLALFRELIAFARVHKAWWIVPLVLMLGLIALLIAAGQGATPFIYTLF